ncbi:hypothetical protein [Pseudochrobactrum saccharolyticum]|uniref:hypothetical protein n=1 Tax=Pseudochrobactrum saccharolyticum TaxID=354352 RepID=UPI00277258CF|nr:hypothetical protein [Pseudochrobactrum saccharolyticum]MDP8249841.1 hypothetical protein [Pseudochrobactrum saccharolyticum]
MNQKLCAFVSGRFREKLQADVGCIRRLFSAQAAISEAVSSSKDYREVLSRK